MSQENASQFLQEQTSATDVLKKFDRALQRELLLVLAESHPHEQNIKILMGRTGQEQGMLETNLSYLEGHGLVRATWIKSGHSRFHLQSARLTAKGSDFLSDDGGLSAILGVVTIKFHDDTIKSLLDARIMASGLPPERKQKYLDQLQSLPADATKRLVLNLVDAGLENWQRVLPLLQNVLG